MGKLRHADGETEARDDSSPLQSDGTADPGDKGSWCLVEKACEAQAKNKGSNKSLLLVNYSVSHYCLKTP